MLLIQTHEAHSSAWPVGLESQPEPHMDFAARVQRAREFVDSNAPPYDVYIDGWDDAYEQRFRAWPDQYYFVDAEMRVLYKSEYGARADALIDYDCLQLLGDIVRGKVVLDGIDPSAVKEAQAIMKVDEEEEEEEEEKAEKRKEAEPAATACGL